MSLTPQFGGLIPSQTQEILESNYLKFNDGGAGNTDTFAQQYLPEIYEQEVERYGNRTLSGFLRMVGAEMPMTSDQVIWSEQNRLHIAYDGVTANVAGTVLTVAPGATQATITNVISVNDTVVVLDPATGAEGKAIVSASVTGSTVGPVAGTIDVVPFDGNAFTVANGFTATGLKVFVYGSAYSKGSNTATGATGLSAIRKSVEPAFTQFSNTPIIIRNQYVVNGSDMAQIGWVEVATEDGASGYLW